MAATDIELKGYLNVGGDCQAESLIGEGAFTIGGELNAGSLDVTVHGNSSAREIGGERIVVRQPVGGITSLTSLFAVFSEKRLTAETIEGDFVWLENTTAKVVRGKQVTIGVGCSIDLVEYAESYTPVEGAQVREARQVASPAGRTCMGTPPTPMPPFK